MATWTRRDIPDLTGRLALVTGATGGLGLETALGLAGAGAEVILAGRDQAKGRRALTRVGEVHPHARPRFEAVDLASLGSVAALSDRLLSEGRPIDILVNNAGVMDLPTRQTTDDGHERQFGVNYLSHFVLTGRLLPLLRQARARVVQLSSVAHRRGRLRLDDLNAKTGYRSWAAYEQSKLAMLMFALELQRRGDAHSWGLISVAAHPGVARTDLVANGPAGRGPVQALVMGLIFRVAGQSAADGTLPILMAATDPDVRPGGYYGPSGFQELRGPPGPAVVAAQARDIDAAARLWAASERLTGVTYR